eukprot:scaffold74840_cov54-Attheya_sp.AAC.1
MPNKVREAHVKGQRMKPNMKCIGQNNKVQCCVSIKRGVTISKQLTGLEYTLCPSSLVNTPYRYVQGAESPRTYRHGVLPSTT